MRGRFHSCPEVLGCGNETLAEIGLPDTVDDHARGSWTPLIHDPFCQAKPVARRAFGKRMQHGEHVWLNFVAGSQPIAALEEVRHAWLGALLQDKRSRRIRPVRPGVLDLLI